MTERVGTSSPTPTERVSDRDSTPPGAPAGETVLSVRDLTVHAGSTPLLHGISFSIQRGERVGLIGESGSGKSITALAVMGLLPEGLTATGEVRLAGQDKELLGASEGRMSHLRGNQMAMVFQEPMTALNPTMKVGRQVAEVLTQHRRADRRAAARRAVELLGQVGLPDPTAVARAYPHQLSGGQRQRVVAAIALANDPQLLICDEPTTALDVTVQALVLDLIVRGVEERDAAMLFITHDLAVVATVCERVLVMYDGRIVEEGPASQVLADPQHDYTQRLVAASELKRRETAEQEGTREEGTDTVTPAVSLRGVNREFRRPRTSLRRPPAVVHAVRDVSIDILPGERFGLVGESGSGKSTLLRMISGLDHPTSGEILIEGRPIHTHSPRQLGWLRRRLQLVFQDPMSSLDPRMRIREIVAEPLVAQGIPRGSTVDELLERVGLPTDAARRFPHQFSGGQRQRISVARALAPDPHILIGDEPVSALDVSVRGQVLELIDEVVERFDLTLIFVSHDLSVVRHVCDRVAVMRAGEIVEVGPTEELYENPQHPYTQQLLASVPVLSEALDGASAAELAERTRAALAGSGATDDAEAVALAETGARADDGPRDGAALSAEERRHDRHEDEGGTIR